MFDASDRTTLNFGATDRCLGKVGWNDIGGMNGYSRIGLQTEERESVCM